MTDRNTTLFSLRYAVRVLERRGVYWSRIGVGFKALSIFSGTAAVAAVVGDKTVGAMIGGAIFAVLQAVEHAFSPGDQKAASYAQRKAYADLLARARALEDAALYTEYQAIVAADEVHCWQPLKELAYNDVVDEKGFDPAAKYPISGFAHWWLRLSD